MPGGVLWAGKEIPQRLGVLSREHGLKMSGAQRDKVWSEWVFWSDHQQEQEQSGSVWSTFNTILRGWISILLFQLLQRCIIRRWHVTCIENERLG